MILYSYPLINQMLCVANDKCTFLNFYEWHLSHTQLFRILKVGPDVCSQLYILRLKYSFEYGICI